VPGPVPAQLFPLHRAFGRGRYRLRHLQGGRLWGMQEDGMARDPRVRSGSTRSFPGTVGYDPEEVSGFAFGMGVEEDRQ